MRKQPIAFLLIFTLLFQLLPWSVIAHAATQSQAQRTFYYDAQWVDMVGIEGGQVLYSAGSGVILSAEHTVTNVDIAHNYEVTAIAEYAFAECRYMFSISLPGSVRTIGDFAFAYLQNVTFISLPEGLEEIGNYAFFEIAGGEGFSDIRIPNSVHSIGINALIDVPFSFNEGAPFSTDGTFIYSNEGETIERYMPQELGASHYDQMVVEIPTTVTEIAVEAFAGLLEVKEVIIPSSVTKIGSGAFSGMPFLETVHLPVLSENPPDPNIFEHSSVQTIYYEGTEEEFTAMGLILHEEVEVIYPRNDVEVNRLDVAAVASQTVYLTWDEATDPRILYYDVYRDDAFIERLPATVSTEMSVGQVDYFDTDVKTGETYRYAIHTVDVDGRLSAPEKITATPQTPQILENSSANRVVSGMASELFIVEDLGQGELTGENSLLGYYADQNGEKKFIGEAEITPSTGEIFYILEWDVTNLAIGDYEVELIYTDVDGGTDSVTETWTVESPEPDSILGVSAVGTKAGVQLSWTKTEEASVTDYRIYRKMAGEGSFTLLHTLTNKAMDDYLDQTAVRGQSYTYYITAVNTGGFESAPSVEVTATATPDTTLPTVDGVQPPANSTLTGSVLLSATASDDESLAKVMWYLVNEKGEETFLAEDATAPYETNFDSTIYEDGDLTIATYSVDTSGNRSTATVTPYRTANDYPEQIVNVVAQGGYDNIQLGWGISNEVTSDRYRIYRRVAGTFDFSLLHTVQGRDLLSYIDRTVVQGETYEYYLTTVADNGLESNPSAIVSQSTVPDTESPRILQMVPDNHTFINDHQTFTVTASDNVTVDQVAWYLAEGEDETLLFTDSTAPFSYSFDTTNYPDGEVTITAYSIDTSGNRSTGTDRYYYIDNTAPAQVVGVEEKELHATQLTLAWADVAEEDVTSFILQQQHEDGFYTRAQGIQTLGYTLENLTPATAYTFRVAAVDHVGNIGAYSEVFTVTTVADTTSPVIKALTPTASRYSTSIPFRATATDLGGIASITVQYGTDLTTFTDLDTKTFDTPYTTQSYSYTVDLSAYPEGVLYLRAVATDFAGNTSVVGSEAPFVEYIVDRTPPEPPTDLAVTAEQSHLTLTWTQGQEADLAGYNLYRATTVDGSYQKIASNLKTVNWHDRTVSANTTYYYQISATDRCGNESMRSTPISAVLATDTTAPVLVKVSPTVGSTLGKHFSTLAVTVTDNVGLRTITVQEGDVKETVMVSGTQASTTISLPQSLFSEGKEQLMLTISVTDQAGNQMTSEVYPYTIDNTPPTVLHPEATLSGGNATVTWKGDLTQTDVSGYKIYRVSEGNTVQIGTRGWVVDGQYSFIDDLSRLADGAYSYRIEGIDKVGNTASVSTETIVYRKEIVNRPPTVTLSVPTYLEVGVEQYFDAGKSIDDGSIQSYMWTFGDGSTADTAKPVKAYQAVGTYTVTLVVTDNQGETTTKRFTVEVKERQSIGTVSVTVEDDSGNRLSGAPVYFGLGTESQYVLPTDQNGQATYTLPVGTHSIGVYQTGFLPAVQSVSVVSANDTAITIVVVEEELVSGSFEVERMDFADIVAAGIDVADSANQNFYQVDVTLKYGEVELPLSYIRDEEEIHQVTVSDSGGTTSNPRPTYTDDDGEERQIGGITYVPNAEGAEIIAILDLPLEASALKEFFDVKLHIINNSDAAFSLVDNHVTLQVPQGMTLMEQVNPQWSTDTTVVFDTLQGGQTKTVHWVLRGDEVGEYHLIADYEGVLDLFEQPISATFHTEDPITVYGLTGLDIQVLVNETINHNTLYFDVGLVNNGQVPLYQPNLAIDELVGNLVGGLGQTEEEARAIAPVLLQLRHEKADGSIVDLPFTVSEGAILYDLPNNTLLPGETLFYEYVAYNVVNYPGTAAFESAAVEVLAGQGGTVTVTAIQKELYSTLGYADKFDSLQSTNHQAYTYLMADSNYHYMQQALTTDYDFGRWLYDLTGIVFQLDLEPLTADERRELIQQQLYHLMVSEEMEVGTAQAVTFEKQVLMGTVLDQLVSDLRLADALSLDEQEALTDVMTALKGEERFLQQLEEGYHGAGADGFTAVLTDLLQENIPVETVETVIEKLQQTGYVDQLFLNAFDDRLTLTEELLHTVQTVADDTIALNNYLYHLLETEVTLQEQYRVLDVILQYGDAVDTTYDNDIRSVAEDLKADMQQNQRVLIGEWSQELLESGATFGAKTAVTQLIAKVGSSVALVYKLLGLTYSGVDWIFGLGDRFQSDDVLEISADLSRIFSYAVSTEQRTAQTPSDQFSTLRNLRYLVELRLFGEEAYNKFVTDYQAEFLEILQVQTADRYETVDDYLLATGHQTLDHYLDEMVVNILKARDAIFFFSGALPPQEEVIETTVVIDTGLEVEAGVPMLATTDLYWQDDWFEVASTTYNQQLATAAMTLSASAYVDAETMVDTLTALQFAEIDTYYDNKTLYGDDDVVAYSFAKKQIGEETLVAIVVRGTKGEEWYSNFNLGAEAEHVGFATAAARLQADLAQYLSDHGIEANDGTKFLVTGHSRGAAVANMIGAYLTDLANSDHPDVVETPNRTNVYAYTFATPRGVPIAELGTGYQNIFNIVNPEDFVPRLALGGWDFGRYGVDLWLPTGSFYDLPKSTIYHNSDEFETLTKERYSYYNSGKIWVDQLEGSFYLAAPTRTAAYDGKVGQEDLPLIDYFNALATVLVTGDEGPLLDISLTSVLYFDITLFFVANNQVLGTVTDNHCPAGYLSWMQSIDQGGMSFIGNNSTFKRATVACPVDVYVYDSKDELVAAVVDETITVDTLSVWVQDGVKIVDLPNTQDYRMKIVARDGGTMDYTVEELTLQDGQIGVTNSISYPDIPLTAGDSFVGQIDKGVGLTTADYNLQREADTTPSTSVPSVSTPTTSNPSASVPSVSEPSVSTPQGGNDGQTPPPTVEGGTSTSTQQTTVGTQTAPIVEQQSSTDDSNNTTTSMETQTVETEEEPILDTHAPMPAQDSETTTTSGLLWWLVGVGVLLLAITALVCRYRKKQ